MYTDYAYAVEEAMGSLGLTLLMNAGGSLMSIAVYVITALSLYTIAKRREISKPWLAWIPIVNCWLLGSIADQYRYVAKGEVKNKRKTLLWLQIIRAVLLIVMIVLFVVMMVDIVQDVMSSSYMDEEEMLISLMGTLGGMMGLLLPISGVSIAYMIVSYMALYDIYASCDPANKTLYLVLSILFNIAQPICLMICRNKDQGMPPRKVLPGAGPQYGQYQAPPYGQYQQPQYQAPQYGQYQQPQYQPPQYQPPQYRQPVTPPQPAAPTQAEPIHSTEELRTPDASESPYSQWPDPYAPQHPEKKEEGPEQQ